MLKGKPTGDGHAELSQTVTRGLWGGENSNLGPTDYESVLESLDDVRL
jgi:hypothetical protein